MGIFLGPNPLSHSDVWTGLCDLWLVHITCFILSLFCSRTPSIHKVPASDTMRLRTYIDADREGIIGHLCPKSKMSV